MIGEFIKIHRDKKGFSQRQLSYLSGISNTEISRIENGDRQNPSPDVLKKLAPHLGVTTEELMKEAGYLPSETVEQQSKMLPQDIRKIARAGENMSPEQLEMWLKMADLIKATKEKKDSD